MARERQTGADQELRDLEQLLDTLDQAAREHDQVSLRVVVDAIGARSFGPLLLLAGLITLAPIVGDIPGVPTLMAVFVLLTAVQLLLRREGVWLPRFLLNRSIACDKLLKANSWVRRPAHFIDRLLKPRLTAMTRGIGRAAIALACILIAAAMPPMELVPFSANGAGAALTAFGLALIAQDGLLALLAFLITGGTFAAVLYALL